MCFFFPAGIMDLIIVLIISSWAHDSPELLYIIASLQLQNFPKKKKKKLGSRSRLKTTCSVPATRIRIINEIRTLISSCQESELPHATKAVAAVNQVRSWSRMQELLAFYTKYVKRQNYRKKYNTRILLILARL
jgi:hypothetical protein